MLQQTTVQAVLPYYERWLRLFPDIRSLAGASLQRVLKAWEGLGYYLRAKNLHRAAQIVTEKYGSRLPQTYEELGRLPGFGPYITAAVLSIAFGRPYPVLDANVRRVLMRLLRMKGAPGAQTEKILRQSLAAAFRPTRPAEFNQSLMELGALICRPKNPRCLICPVQDYCSAFAAGEQEVIPAPRRRSSKKIQAVVGIIRRNGKYLIQKRPPAGLLPDLWEFPGGKRQGRERLEDCLRREIKEELGAEVIAAKRLLKVRHSYTQFNVTLYAYETIIRNPPARPTNNCRWVTLRALKRYPFPSGSARIVRFLEERG
jgi:A/G-specific adenine glycosylase